MNNVRRFNTCKMFNNYINSRITDICLGMGSEGSVYLGRDGLAYKIYNDDVIKYDKFCSYKEDDFVTVKDINLDSFAFPIELFCVKGRIFGYTSKYVDKDLLLNNFIRNGFLYNIKNCDFTFTKEGMYDILLQNMKEIDLKKMKNAYEKLYDDTMLLSKKGIKINDLYGNILFDGESFVVVDTDNYIKTKDDVRLNNSILLENSLKMELEYLNNILSDSYINRNKKVFSYIKDFCKNVDDVLLYNNYINNNCNIKKLSIKK